MNSAITSAAPPNGRGNTRSSLACLPCRSRHLKCDGARPHCSRCIEATKQCQYAQSRRGGLDRAALAERRKRLEAAGRNQGESADSSSPPQPSWTHQPREPTPPRPSGHVGADLTNSYCLLSETSSSGSLAAPRVDIDSDIAGDPLIASYYKSFHKFHPLVLPQKHLTRVHQDPGIQLNLRPLIAILRFIGHIYSSQEWSDPLRDHVETCFAEVLPADPIMVQCRVLYSIALFWSSYKDEAKRQMDAAVQLGLGLRMFRQDFAAEHGAQDAVLTESWRRTWWMLYIVDAFYAGTLGTMNFTTLDVDATVDLPCEELDYEQGVSSPPPILFCHHPFLYIPVSHGFDQLTKLRLSVANSRTPDTARFRLPRLGPRINLVLILCLSHRCRTMCRISHIYSTKGCGKRRLPATSPSR